MNAKCPRKGYDALQSSLLANDPSQDDQLELKYNVP